jgi:hypothetical protein
MAPRSTTRDDQVLVIAHSPETLDGLQAYLRSVGITSHGSRSILRAAEHLEATVGALVLFPDDDDFEQVIGSIRRIQRGRPSVLIILVTREPQRFQSRFEATDRSTPPLVLPRASFGWSILDAIRARREAAASS